MAAPLSFYLEPDDSDNVEDIHRYTAGGFHPIRLGDVISSPASSGDSRPTRQYRIMHKLGRGAFATVWLAEVLRAPSRTYVALKICIADASLHHEVDIFKRIPQTDETQNVVHLRDSFPMRGPNGVHMVLVQDVLGDPTNYKFIRLLDQRKDRRRHTRMMSRQVACGVAALHRHGIAHGDLDMNNIGIALPSLGDHSLRDILDSFGNPELCIVLPTVPPERPQAEALPPYLVSPISIIEFLVEADPDFVGKPVRAEIMDFGNALLVDEQTRPFCTHAAVCAPELMFERIARSVDPPPTREADIWSLACTIFQLAFRQRLFHWATPNDALLGAMAELCGEVPLGWKDHWKASAYLSKLDISPEVANAKWQSRRNGLVSATSDVFAEDEVDELIALLRSMLGLDPKLRPSAEEVLQHPWFARADETLLQ